jgi:hypothetical protein
MDRLTIASVAGVLLGMLTFSAWVYLTLNALTTPNNTYMAESQICQSMNRGEAIIINGLFEGCTADRPGKP